MELVEKIEDINQRLIDYFGIDTSTGEPIWRVVWSEDQFENRLTNYTSEGLELLYPEMKLLPKYKQWIHEKYVLERLVVVPPINLGELITKTNYEPMWVFQDNLGQYLPPLWLACKLVVDTVYAAMGRKDLARYVEPENSRDTLEAREARISELQNELFGNETRTGDSLAHKEAIVVPDKMKIN